MSRFSTGSRLVGMRDEVDELLEAWGRERNDLDLAPVGVFSRITRLSRRLELERKEAFAAHGIEQWEFDVLAALRRAGAPYELSPGRLLHETLVTSGTMTNRVDRLSARGLVERSAHIRYSGYDLDGKKIERTARGFHARVVQHECDHLDGILYPSRMSDLGNLIFETEAKHWMKDG